MKMTKAENGVDIEFMNENSNLEFRGPPQAEILSELIKILIFQSEITITKTQS